VKGDVEGNIHTFYTPDNFLTYPIIYN
jgi:hypothetical protein